MSTKSQVWTTDFIISIMLFIALFLLFGKTIFDLTNESREEISPLVMEGKAVSDSLVSEGYPENWNNDTVSKIGLTTDNRIDGSKISAFYSMNYSDAKKLFNTPYDFFVFLSDENNKLISVDGRYGFGNPLVNATQDNVVLSGIDFEKLAKIDRIVIYNSKIVKMVIYLWD
jgi:hypothetical protein